MAVPAAELAAPKLFYGSPPNFSFNEIAHFKTSFQSYLLKHGVPRHPDVIDR